MRQSLIFIFAFIYGISSGQTFVYPSIKLKGEKVSDFIPIGWTILDSANGDLNKDGKLDAAIILQKQDSVSVVNDVEDTVMAQPRILIILFRSPTVNDFEVKEQSNSFILMHDNSVMDDPYQGISIEKGVLILDFHLFYSMGSWYTSNSTYKFRFDGKEFILIGADLSTVHRASLDFEDYSYNFLTRKRNYSKGNEQTGKKTTAVKSLPVQGPMTLRKFKEPYSWEVEKDIYL